MVKKRIIKKAQGGTTLPTKPIYTIDQDIPETFSRKSIWDNKKFPDMIKEAANKVGLDPADVGIFASNMFQEGMNKAAIKPDERSEAWGNAYKLDKTLGGYPVDAFYNYGMDSFGEMAPKLIKEGYLPKDLKYKAYNALNDKGDPITTAAFLNNQDAIMAGASMFKYNRDRVKKYADSIGLTLDKKANDYFTSASYNYGPNGVRGMMRQYKEQGAKNIDEYHTTYKGVDKNIKPRISREEQLSTYLKAYGGQIDDVSRQGYKEGSPYENEDQLRINSNQITMKGVKKPLMLRASNGQQTPAFPGDPDVLFPGASYVDETPIDVPMPRAKSGKWIPKHMHEGRCTPLGKPGCPKGSPQYNLAVTFKKHHGFHKKGEDGFTLNPLETNLAMAKDGIGLPNWLASTNGDNIGEIAKGGYKLPKAQDSIHLGYNIPTDITANQDKTLNKPLKISPIIANQAMAKVISPDTKLPEEATHGIVQAAKDKWKYNTIGYTQPQQPGKKPKWGDYITPALSALDAFIPGQPIQKPRVEPPMTYNQYAYGTGSQAIAEHGMNLPCLDCGGSMQDGGEMAPPWMQNNPQDNTSNAGNAANHSVRVIRTPRIPGYSKKSSKKGYAEFGKRMSVESNPEYTNLNYKHQNPAPENPTYPMGNAPDYIATHGKRYQAGGIMPGATGTMYGRFGSGEATKVRDGMNKMNYGGEFMEGDVAGGDMPYNPFLVNSQYKSPGNREAIYENGGYVNYGPGQFIDHNPPISHQNGGELPTIYEEGKTYDVPEEELKRLVAAGYEFKIS